MPTAVGCCAVRCCRISARTAVDRLRCTCCLPLGLVAPHGPARSATCCCCLRAVCCSLLCGRVCEAWRAGTLAERLPLGALTDRLPPGALLPSGAACAPCTDSRAPCTDSRAPCADSRPTCCVLLWRTITSLERSPAAAPPLPQPSTATRFFFRARFTALPSARSPKRSPECEVCLCARSGTPVCEVCLGARSPERSPVCEVCLCALAADAERLNVAACATSPAVPAVPAGRALPSAAAFADFDEPAGTLPPPLLCVRARGFGGHPSAEGVRTVARVLLCARDDSDESPSRRRLAPTPPADTPPAPAAAAAEPAELKGSAGTVCAPLVR